MLITLNLRRSHKTTEGEMKFIETFPNLKCLIGLKVEDQSDSGHLDALFDSCGRSLEELDFKCRESNLPSALLRDGLRLRKLSISTKL